MGNGIIHYGIGEVVDIYICTLKRVQKRWQVMESRF